MGLDGTPQKILAKFRWFFFVMCSKYQLVEENRAPHIRALHIGTGYFR